MLGEPGRCLIGRRAELDRLARAVDRLGRGLPTVVDIVAEPGMGRTSMLAELARLVGDRPVLRARATEYDQAMPYGVLARALEGAGRRLSDAPRHETYRAVRALLVSLAEPAGAALLLDDVHWADGDSLALLGHLLESLPEAGVLVAVTYRRPPARLLDALAAPEVAARRERVELGPLTPADSAVLAGARDIAPAGGNPLYLLAFARTGTWSAVLSDVDSASPAARQVAMAAAVVDDLDLVAEVAGLDRPAADAAVDELRRRDVLEPGRLTFRHPSLRRLVYESASPDWRRSAHRSAAAALRRRGAPAPAEAVHLERCADAGDLDAAEVLLEAADLAGTRAPASAARWVNAALALLPAGDARPTHELRLARYLVLAGQFADARDGLRNLAAHLPSHDPRRTEVAVLHARVERLLGDHDNGRRRLVAELARSTPDSPAHGEPALELATVDLMAGTVSAWTVELAGHALAMHDRATRATAHAVAAIATHLLGDLDAAIAHCDAAARELDGLADAELTDRLDACVWTGWAENTLSRYRSALAHLDRGIALAERTGQAHPLCHLLVGRAVGRRWLGRLPAARDDADEAVEVARVCRGDELLALATRTRAWIGALTSDEVSRPETGGPATGWWATNAGFVAVVAQAESGEPVPAGERLLTVGGGADLPRVDPFGRPAWYEQLVRTAVAAGDLAAAARWATRAADATDDRLPVGAGLAELARAESLRPADPEARQSARRAIELFAAAGTPVEQARATAVLATAMAASGQVAAARKLVDQAATRFAACGATRLAEQTRVRLGDGGPTKPSLSPREREVAELVTRGCTNRQIAAQLLVTEKTVETHLSRIFTKLDLTSRYALAAWAVAVRD